MLYIYIFVVFYKASPPTVPPSTLQTRPPGNTAPAITTSLQATSEPLRAHFETTWLENTRKHWPRSHFVEVTWTARKHRACRQIRPRSETYVRSRTHVHSNTQVRLKKATFRETSLQNLSRSDITCFTSLCFTSLRALHARVHTSLLIYTYTGRPLRLSGAL